MKTDRGFWMKKASDGDSAELLIYEQIGEDWFGGISAKKFTEDLKALGDIKTLNVRINSPGGDVFAGTAIYNQLVQHKATVNVFIDGLAASAASFIAMAGDTIKIAENAMFMVHRASGLCVGNEEDMRKMADILDKVDANIVTVYQRRSKQPENKIQEWLKAETWMSGADAVANGFADSLMEAKAVNNSFDLSRFRNAPKQTADDEMFLVEQMRMRLALARSA